MAAVPIINKVKEKRFFADEMTQQALADLVGVTRQTIMAIEKGKYSPSLEVAFKIAHVFNTNLDDIFQYSPEDPVKGC
ncbi:helix-turn-helix transcriptional regulator [Aliiglaciecola sp. LCG003]|uniref:helix-turn-helix transcriptional regulator n=1 Tax=Aliiglaciecola sp. LCG003 TaxID=3053655 RepID=UPI002572CB0D|nr:helix-turn-helix transcriptional regulator [Aliiglaciecola sp. LCG003]WJG09228.1 helix-turn-helix transcriptional regulator [Aliiglaciecola sp. LCG003]